VIGDAHMGLKLGGKGVYSRVHRRDWGGGKRVPENQRDTSLISVQVSG
jgi:hypothetical protein